MLRPLEAPPSAPAACPACPAAATPGAAGGMLAMKFTLGGRSTCIGMRGMNSVTVCSAGPASVTDCSAAPVRDTPVDAARQLPLNEMPPTRRGLSRTAAPAGASSVPAAVRGRRAAFISSSVMLGELLSIPPASVRLGTLLRQSPGPFSWGEASAAGLGARRRDAALPAAAVTDAAAPGSEVCVTASAFLSAAMREQGMLLSSSDSCT